MITIFALRKACLTLVLLLGASTLSAGHRGVNVSIHEGDDPVRCDQISVLIGDRPAQRGEESLAIAADAGHPLRVEVPVHSGVRVREERRADFEILLCKAAPTAQALGSITLSRTGGAVTVVGPAGEDWVGYLLIAAPRGAAMDLSATNGPIGLAGLSGSVSVRSQNGPISVRDCSGDIDAQAQNGPIEVSGGGGRQRLHTQNGPISVSLSGSAWDGAGLEASAVNGPLALVIPPGYRSGAVVESLGHSPFHCRGDACAGARRSWDDRTKRLEFGEGPTLVRLSTENGPVSVSSDANRDEDEEDE
jgi:hypothetical protein